MSSVIASRQYFRLNIRIYHNMVKRAVYILARMVMCLCNTRIRKWQLDKNKNVYSGHNISQKGQAKIMKA